MTPVEYLVITKCGRRFGWAALDMNQLFRDLHERGYVATSVQPMTEYEAEIFAREEQEILVGELKESA